MGDMSDTDMPNLDVKKILYPYIKILFPSSKHQQWFLSYYEATVKPYVISLVEKDFFAKQKVTKLSDQINYLRYYFSYIDRDTNILPDSLYTLVNGLAHIRPITRDFENQYFNNVFRRKNGFTADDFYPSHYQSILKKLLQKTLLIYTYEKIKQGLEVDPENPNYQKYHQWINARIRAEHIPEKLTGFKTDKAFYQPNLLWYFINGANRVPLFLQIEWYHLKKMFNEMGQWITHLSNHPRDLRNALFVFPLTSIMFSIRVLFLVLMPYRLLRTLANEVYHQISDMLHRFLLTCKPNFKENTSSNITVLLTNILIYGSILSIMSLPILPIPFMWLPNVFFSPYIALVPISYLAMIPMSSLCLSVYKKEFAKRNPPQSQTQLKPKEPSHLLDEASNKIASKPVLFQFPEFNKGNQQSCAHQDKVTEEKSGCKIKCSA